MEKTLDLLDDTTLEVRIVWGASPDHSKVALKATAEDGRTSAESWMDKEEVEDLIDLLTQAKNILI